MSDKTQIFISYSHKDAAWLEKLLTFLGPLLLNEELLTIWSDTDINLSSDWRADIKKALLEANAAILLISQNFLASEFIASNELPQLLSAADQRGLRIFPVYVSSCYLRKNSPLLRYQGVTSPDNPLDTLDEATQNKTLVKLVKAIDELISVNARGITQEWLEKFRSRFAPVVGGIFTIGDNALHEELKALPEHKIEVASFHIGRYAITQSEWFAVMGTRPWLKEEDEGNVIQGDDIPAIWVNWRSIMNFLRKLNRADTQFVYRLPSEAEWEYAARDGQYKKHLHEKFSFGNEESDLIDYGWHDRNASSIGDAYAHSVGELQPNDLGLFDMHGNVWEWLLDHDGVSYVVHGGGFNASAIAASSAYRIAMKPETKGVALGFRLIQERKK